MVVDHSGAQLFENTDPLALEVVLEPGDVFVPLSVQDCPHLLHLLLAVEKLTP